MTYKLYSSAAVTVTIVASFAGCSHRVATYPVKGTVHFDDGEPVRIGSIEFRCPQTGVCARAKLNEDGTFSLGTFAADDGAPAGDYKIIIVQYFNAAPRGHVHSHRDDDDDGSQHADAHASHIGNEHPDARVATKFADYSTTTLRATVMKDGKNDFKFVVNHPN